MNNWSDEQTDEPLYADDRNFYKVEAWSREGMRIDALLYAGSNLDKAREIFVTTIKHRPGIKADHPPVCANILAPPCPVGFPTSRIRRTSDRLTQDVAFRAGVTKRQQKPQPDAGSKTAGSSSTRWRLPIIGS